MTFRLLFQFEVNDQSINHHIRIINESVKANDEVNNMIIDARGLIYSVIK